MAMRRAPDIAINHDKDAPATHVRNHQPANWQEEGCLMSMNAWRSYSPLGSRF
jgi:hypothetical protein